MELRAEVRLRLYTCSHDNGFGGETPGCLRHERGRWGLPVVHAEARMGGVRTEAAGERNGWEKGAGSPGGPSGTAAVVRTPNANVRHELKAGRGQFRGRDRRTNSWKQQWRPSKAGMDGVGASGHWFSKCGLRYPYRL